MENKKIQLQRFKSDDRHRISANKQRSKRSFFFRLVKSHFLYLFLVSGIAKAETLKLVPNPFTGKLDYITKLSSTTIPTGSTNYVQTNPSSKQTTAVSITNAGIDSITATAFNTTATSMTVTKPLNYTQATSGGIGYVNSNKLVIFDGLFGPNYGVVDSNGTRGFHIPSPSTHYSGFSTSATPLAVSSYTAFGTSIVGSNGPSYQIGVDINISGPGVHNIGGRFYAADGTDNIGLEVDAGQTILFGSMTVLSSDGAWITKMTVSTITLTGQIKFNNRNCLETAPDGTCVLSMPETQSLFTGYNTNLINTGGVFNTSYGTTAMPYPGGGNFNTCIGNACMSGNVITTAENNNSMGYASCGALRAGFYNNCMGGSAGLSLRDGNFNTLVGTYAGALLTDENGVTLVGYEAGRYQLTGPYVTGLGFQAGVGTTTLNANTTGSGNTYLGMTTGQDVPSATAINNSFAVGIGALFHASNEGQLGGRNGSGYETLTRTSSMTVESTLISNRLETVNFSKYNAIATVSNGIPAEYATIDTTGLTANVGASTLYAVPATGAGMYRVSSYTVETTAGSVSSTLPNVQIVYTDKETSGAITIDATPVLGVAGIGQTGALTSNTIGTASSGVIVISVKASTTIQYQTVNYASSLAGMTYAIHLKLEAL